MDFISLLRLKACVFLLLLISNLAQAQTPEAKFRHIRTQAGLSSPDATCIFQDSKGVIWIGTEKGLNRYDAYRIQVYQPRANDPNSLSHAAINTIYEDAEQNLWIGTESGLNRYVPQEDHFVQYSVDQAPDQPTPLKIHDILSIDKKLYLGTGAGLQIFDPETEQTQIFQIKNNKRVGELSNAVHRLLVDKKQRIWLGTAQGLCFFDGKEITRVEMQPSNFPDFPKSFQVSDMNLDKQDNLWLCTREEGVLRFNLRDRSAKAFRQRKNNPRTLLSNLANALQLSKDQKKLWIATQKGISILEITTETFTNITPDPSDSSALSGANCQDLWADQMGGMWIALDQTGVSYYHPNNNLFRHLTAASGASRFEALPDEEVRFVYIDPKQHFWIGHREGLSRYDPKTSRIRNYTQASDLVGTPTLASFGDEAGNLWLSTRGGVNYVDTRNGKWLAYQEGEKGLKGQGTAIYRDVQKNVWLGTDAGLMQFKITAPRIRFISYRYPDGIRAILGDQASNLWIGSTSGLARFDKKSKNFIPYEYKSDQGNLVKYTVNCLFEDSQQRLWVGTEGQGWLLLDKKNKQFRNYTEQHGLPSNTIRAIVEEKPNVFWLSTREGLCRVRLTNNTKQKTALQVQYFSSQEGLQSGEFMPNSAYKGKEGTICFGGTNGLNFFHPADIQGYKGNIPVRLTELKINGQTIRAHQEDSPLEKPLYLSNALKLNHTDTELWIGFAGLYYADTHKLEYAYQLEGYDEEWKYVGRQNFATYTNLPRGVEYQFRVKVSNGNGKWTELETPLSIYIRSPYWETWWFWAFIISVFIGLMYGAFRTGAYVVGKQKRELEQIVQTRSQALEKTSDLLEEQQQEIVRHNQVLSEQQEKINHQNAKLQIWSKEIINYRDFAEQKQYDLDLLNAKLARTIQAGSLIQQAMLPDSKHLHRLLEEHFIIYRPKQVISGDFYWVEQVAHKTFVAAVDCTGYGILGGLMSMLGSAFLDKIIAMQKNDQPAQILELLHQALYQALEQEQAPNNYGMEMVLVSLEKLNKHQTKIVFSGAKSPMYYLSRKKGSLGIIRGDRRAIGGNQNLQVPFTQREFILESGDLIYLGTDGFINQNDEQRRKFGDRRFKSLIEENAHLLLPLQKKAIEKALDEHQGQADQRDDLLMIGLRL